MEKRLRSSLEASPEEFLSSLAKSNPKSSKPALKTLIHSIPQSSSLSSSLPLSLHNSIAQSILSFQTLINNSQSSNPNLTPNSISPKSPPTKRLRRSSRHSKTPQNSNPHESKTKSRKQKIVEKLRTLAYLVHLCVTSPKKAFLAGDLLDSVKALHDGLIFFESDSVLCCEIAGLCEEWWKEGLEGRESLISQFLPYLVSRSLTLKKKVDVHRVYTLRDAFGLFDFDDESIKDLKCLLIRCVIAPLYLKTEDGRRFVAFMFGLSRQLMKEALAMIKSQIPFGRKSMLEAYGDIVFRAWKVAEGDLREEIENGFLRCLVEGAIHASSGAFAASIRRVLGGFITQRTVDGVEKMLFRLSEPVIFRSLQMIYCFSMDNVEWLVALSDDLRFFFSMGCMTFLVTYCQVANSNVRQNALHLLLDMFPLEDPDSTKEVKDTLLDKQFYLLERLLLDDCPDTRVVAVEGCCRILHLFWEVIPSSTITKIITKIFDEMSHDISNDVRVSTLNGIVYLLGNPQSHEVLKVLLPRLGHLMTDSSISVRAALADLLLVIRDIRNFQFNKVVALETLLSTLASDQEQVSQKITKLLMPSYFPSKVTVEDACSRCVTLIKRSPLAGARFCEYIFQEGASLKSLMQLFRVIISLLLSPDKLQNCQIEGLLDGAMHLCKSLVTEPCYKDAMKEMLANDKLKFLFAVTPSAHAQSSVFSIASVICPQEASCLVEKCIDLVTNCCGTIECVEWQSELRSAHRLLLLSDRFSDMLEAFLKLLENTALHCKEKFGFESSKQFITSTKKKKSHSSAKSSARRTNNGGKSLHTLQEDYAIALGVAWQIEDLLSSEDFRDAILGSQVLEPLFNALKFVSEVSIVECAYHDYMDIYPVMAYTTLALHMASANIKPCKVQNFFTKINESACSSKAVTKNVIEQTVDHLIYCAEKLSQAGETSNSAFMSSKSNGNKKGSKRDASPSDDGDSSHSRQRRISMKVKMLTAILKFIVDSITMRFDSCNTGRCLNFTSAYMQHIISSLREQTTRCSQFEEDSLKEMNVCLKSSFTYAMKLLNLVFKDTKELEGPFLEAFDLANDLLDLITCIELGIGPSWAMQLVTAAKPWLPELILALGSAHMLDKNDGSKPLDVLDHMKQRFPSWLLVLAKSERNELRDESYRAEDGSTSALQRSSVVVKLMAMAIALMGGNSSLLDVFGMFFLTGSLIGLERDDLGLVLGLIRFVCLKLVGQKDGHWDKLDQMLESFANIYPYIEKKMEEQSYGDRYEKLDIIRTLLERVWTYRTNETETFGMEE